MSIAELKAVVDQLNDEDRQKLRDHLRAKIAPMDEETRRRMAEKIADKNPAHWLTLEELKEKLGD